MVPQRHSRLRIDDDDVDDDDDDDEDNGWLGLKRQLTMICLIIYYLFGESAT